MKWCAYGSIRFPLWRGLTPVGLTLLLLVLATIAVADNAANITGEHATSQSTLGASSVSFGDAVFRDIEEEFYTLAHAVSTNHRNTYPTIESAAQAFDEFQRSLAAQGIPVESPEYLYVKMLGLNTLSAMLLYQPQEARPYFEEAFAIATRLIDAGIPYSNIYAVFALLQFQLHQFSGVFEWVFYITTIEQLNGRAHTLDRENPQAWINYGLTNLLAPFSVKSQQDAFEALNIATAKGNSYYQYWAQIWLAAAHAKEGNRTTATAILHQLEQSFPHSRVLERLAILLTEN